MKKIVPICIAGILLCTAFSAAALTTKHTSSDDLSILSPLVFVFGEKGKNNWYISDVQVSFQWNPSDVDEIWYRLKVGENFVKYTGPFTVTEDGSHIIPWYWIDKNGSKHTGLNIEFGIDKTQPTIELTKRVQISKDVEFTATAADLASGIERVEFYCDEVLVANLTQAPYVWTWSYIKNKNQDVQAFAYDFAGHMKESNILGTPCPYIPNLFVYIRLLIQRFFLLV